YNIILKMLLKSSIASACLLHLLTSSTTNAWVIPSNNDDKYLHLHAKRDINKINNNLLKRDNNNNKDFETNLEFVRLGFYLDVEVGSNNDTVTVLLDTGSSDFWFP
ncbi:hypothetical protein C6P42_005109, partial [Pichia californica]